MSIDIDTRARGAGARMRQAVGAADLDLAVPPSKRSRAPMFGYAIAGAAAALVVLVAIFSMPDPSFVASDEDTLATTTIAPPSTTLPSTTLPTTLPSTTAPNRVAPPAAPSTTAPPAPTTTADTEPPMIEITSPEDGQVFQEESIVFTGVTEPGASVFAGPYRATVSPEGVWSIRLILSPGANRSTFTAVDAAGNSATATVTAVLERAKDAEPDVKAFTASATWIECRSSPPFDEYHGTGQPGSRVSVTSPYGSGETTVREDGSWYVKVVFLEAPIGTVFEVRVSDQLGRSKTFDFVALEPR